MSKRVQDKKIVITGASSGIGAEGAKQLAAKGAYVILVARRAEELEKVQQAIVAAGGKAESHVADLSNYDEIDALADVLLQKHGKIDVLVNNAGRSIRRSVRNSLERFHDYERCMQINYFGLVRLTLKLLPPMLEAGDGHIINVTTWATLVPSPRFAAYVASKRAVDGFTETLDTELVGTGVATTLVHYPLVKTPMIAPTKLYSKIPTMSVERAGGWLVRAVKRRPKRVVSPTMFSAGVGSMVTPRTSRWISRKLGI